MTWTRAYNKGVVETCSGIQTQILVPSTKYQYDGHYLCTVHIPSIQYQYQYTIWLQYLRVAGIYG